MAELAEMFAPLSPVELAAMPNAGTSEGGKRPIVPVPEDTPAMRFRHPQHGAPTRAWPYHEADGRLVGYVCRWDFETTDGVRDKLILPVTFCELAGLACGRLPGTASAGRASRHPGEAGYPSCRTGRREGT